MNSKNLLYFLVVFTLFSCTELIITNNEKSKQLISKTKKHSPNKDSIFFEIKFIAELGDDKYEELRVKAEEDFKPIYKSNYVEVSKEVYANACAKYEGDFQIKKDSLFLILRIENEDDYCSCTSIRKVNYKIRIDKNIKYKVSMKYE